MPNVKVDDELQAGDARDYRATRKRERTYQGNDEYFADLQSEIDVTNGFAVWPSKRHSFRAGKWTVEEEVYSEYLISLFVKGLLVDCEENTTLRAYLAEKLNCKPMRITKKYASTTYDGKATYHLVADGGVDTMHLAALRDNYMQSIVRPKPKRSHKKKSQDNATFGVYPISSLIEADSLSKMEEGDGGDPAELEILRSPMEPDSAESVYSDDDAEGQLTPEDIEMIKEAFE